MGFSGIFAIGLSGINAQSASLEAISNNIANSQTVGFRRSQTDFSQLIAREQSAATTAGTGVNATNRQLINEQGFITRTQNATDLAVSGSGFFVISENAGNTGADNPLLFTRAGDFRTDGDGNLVNSAGYFLRGQAIGPNGAGTIGGANSLQTINLANIEGTASATTQISLGAIFSQTSSPSPASASYNPADPANNLASGAIAADLAQSFTIFDANGNADALTLAFVRIGPNQIGVEAFDPASNTNLPVASGTLSFNNDGSLDAANSTFPAAINLANGSAPVAIDLSTLALSSGATRTVSTASNGASFGSVTGFSINDDGILSASLSNGQSRDLFQIPLALFTNAEGLDAIAATAFRFDPAAGELDLVASGSERAGQIEGAALEASTVDIGREFTTLIETQRAYSANARIITIADDLLRTLNDTAI